MRDPRSILITGASSGLGAALARVYAGRGVRLALTGRDRNRLALVADGCRLLGAAVESAPIDVTEADKLARWMAEMDETHPLDLVIANAGISGGSGGAKGGRGAGERGETGEQVRRIFAVNIDGVLNTVMPAIALMRSRGRGQIALMSSLAGFRGLPSSPAYSASKAAVRVHGEALRGLLRRDGIEVSVICPGYVRTPMTRRNNFPMPFLMDAERAAVIMKRGLARGRARIAYPWPMYALVWLLQALPPGWLDPILGRLPAKS
jgi:short-subunit dehydrogenase